MRLIAKVLVVGVVCTAFSFAAPSQAASENRILTHREQEPIVRGWIEKRFDVLLPELMRREGIDMWIIVTREYNSDPVFRSMAPLTTYESRRRSILVFTDLGPGKGVERLSVGRFDYSGLFEVHRTLNHEQWEGLRTVVEERNPKVIGINTSELWNHADGITANEKDNLTKALGPEYAGHVRSAENLAVGWLETKLPEETVAYQSIMQVAHQVIAEAFSNRVIVPGQTTTEDVVWWMRQRVAEMGLGQWFQPSVNLQRAGEVPERGQPGYDVIQRGDMLHCDFGIVYLGFYTDTQHNAYVLAPGETDVPEGIKAGQRAANRLQDIVMENGRPGVTGNEALAASLAQARSEGLVPDDLLSPGRLPRPCRRSAHRYDRLPRRGSGKGGARLEAEHLVRHRAQRYAQGTRVGRQGCPVRAGRRRGSTRGRVEVD